MNIYVKRRYWWFYCEIDKSNEKEFLYSQGWFWYIICQTKFKSNQKHRKDSITAKESQVKELLIESQENIKESEHGTNTNIVTHDHLKEEATSINPSEQKHNSTQELDKNSLDDDSLSKILSITSTFQGINEATYKAFRFFSKLKFILIVIIYTIHWRPIF